MKKVLVSILCLGLVLFFSGCTTNQPGGLEIDNNVVTDPVVNGYQDEDIESDTYYSDAVKALDKIFASGGRYKCEIINRDNGYNQQTLFIDGENYRVYGYDFPKNPDLYEILGNITSNAVGVRQGSDGFCNYIWSTAVNDKGTRTEKGLKACDKSYSPERPFEVDDMAVGAFQGVTPELIKTCVLWKQPVDYSIPSEQEFIDFTELGELGDALNNSGI